MMCIFLAGSNVWASGRVYVPYEYFSYAGYTIEFNFDQLLMPKGYVRVEQADQADYVLEVLGEEVATRRFQNAKAQMILTNLKTGVSLKGEKTRRCMTQSCGISDFAKAFNQSYKELDALIPAIENDIDVTE